MFPTLSAAPLGAGAHGGRAAPALSPLRLPLGSVGGRRAARWGPSTLLVAAVCWFAPGVNGNQAKELPTIAFPKEGAGGPDTYLPNATLISCALLDPYPAAVSVPWNPTYAQAKAFCSLRVQCGGFVYTSAAANLANSNGNLATASYCLPQAFVAGTISATTGVAFVRHIYGSCDIRISLTSVASYHYGTLTDTRKACIRPGRGLTPARDREPRPRARKYEVRPKPGVWLGGHHYEVGKEVFVDVISAQNHSADGSTHTMISSAGIYYYMPGASHANLDQAEKPFARDGWYPLYSTENGAKAADTRGGGNGQAFQVGPTSTLGKPIKWLSAPHVQVQWMAYKPDASHRLFYGDYVAPFAFDGYYPLYKSVTDAEKASSTGVAQWHGPTCQGPHCQGHPLAWSDGQIRLYYMPADPDGGARYYGTYYNKSLADVSMYSHTAALQSKVVSSVYKTLPKAPSPVGEDPGSFSAAQVFSHEAMPTNTAAAAATLSAAPYWAPR